MSSNETVLFSMTVRQVPASLNLDRCRIVAHACLHKIGDQKPYFSVTADVYRGGQDIGGGCMHEEILKIDPSLHNLVALHLSDEDGVPTHAAANGYYWIAGYFTDGMGEKYHGGNSTPALPPENCLRIAARLFRITNADAATLACNIHAEWRERGTVAAKKLMGIYVQSQRPRWKMEAENAIRKYRLKVVES